MKVRNIHKGAGMRHRANDSQIRAGFRILARFMEQAFKQRFGQDSA